MNAPTIWIISPIAFAVLLLLITNQRVLSLLGGGFAVALALTAQFMPIEEAIRFGSFSFSIDSPSWDACCCSPQQRVLCWR
jgi:hypothetical protein